MAKEVFDIDGRMSLSLRTLLFKPGELTLECARGRRSRYAPPLRLYLVISSLFFRSVLLSGTGEILNSGSDEAIVSEDQYPRLAFLMGRQRPVPGRHLGGKSRVVFLDKPVKERLLGAMARVHATVSLPSFLAGGLAENEQEVGWPWHDVRRQPTSGKSQGLSWAQLGEVRTK